MGFVMPHVMVLAGGGCALVALILQIVGVATPEWISAETQLGDMTQGLWEFCRAGSCAKLEDLLYWETPSWLEAVRAFGILAIFAIFACLVCVALICLMSDKPVFGLFAPIAAAAGAFCCLIAFAVFAGESSSSDYGYSFALVIVAFLLCIAAAVLLFVGKGRKSA